MTAEVRHTTGIQWTHVLGYRGATWNPSVGCTRVSPGCDNCYAFTLHDQRYMANLKAARAAVDGAVNGVNAIATARRSGVVLPCPPQYDRPFSAVQMLDDRRLTQPLRAKAPHAYFVDSMADLFHEDVTDEFIDRVFAVMAQAPRHIFMILTKRPERMREYVSSRASASERTAAFWGYVEASAYKPSWPLANVWVGVSAEDQQRADERIPLLLDTPAAVRFVSAEPLLGPIDFGDRAMGDGWFRPGREHGIPALDWVIVGGESGARARPFDLGWARDIVEQCRVAGVAPFVKQLGAHPKETEPNSALYLKNRHGSDMEEWPMDLRIREFPSVRA